jgi:opacity protein-like surface antigen
MKLNSTIIRITIIALAALVAQFLVPSQASAQGLDLTGGWTHATGDFGVDGFDIGAGWFFSRQVSLNAEYDGLWDTSRVGTFEFTSVGAIVSQSHLQDFLVGPRYYFSPQKIQKDKTRRYVLPFVEAQFGVSHLRQSIQEGTALPVVASDSAFSWLLGGGVDYVLSPHWTARANLGLLRTHLNAEGQSRFRFALGIAYTFGERKPATLRQ